MTPGKARFGRTPLAYQNYARTIGVRLINERYGKVRERVLNNLYRKQGFLSEVDRLELNQLRVSLGGPGYHRIGPPGHNTTI